MSYKISRKVFVFSICLFLLIPSVLANIILNPGFETGNPPSNWVAFFNISGSFNAGPGYVGSQSGRATINTVSTNDQLYQRYLTLEPNTQYNLSFYAYSSTGHNVRVGLFNHTNSSISYGVSNWDVNLGTSWQYFERIFTTPDLPSLTDGRLYFGLHPFASNGDVYYFDEIILEEVVGGGESEDLVLHLAFEGDALDSSGNGNDGTLFGGVSFDSGKIGQAAEFDAVNDYVSIPYDSSINFEDEDISFSAWFTANFDITPAGNPRYLFSKNYGPDGVNWYGASYDTINAGSSGVLRCHFDDGSIDSCVPNYTYNYHDGGWHLLTCVRDKGINQIVMYVDGNPVKLMTDSCGSISNTSSGIVVGGRYDLTVNRFWNGSIDDFKIYDYALSSEEVLNLYNQFGSTVTRDIVPLSVGEGGIVMVTLDVTLVGEETYYAIDEDYPEDWTVQSAPGANTSLPGKLRWVNINISEDFNRSYTYTIQAPSSGSYTFNGNYSFENLTGPIEIFEIEGDKNVEVANCDLTSAQWGVTDAINGTSVNLLIYGNSNCEGSTINFTILEKDLWPNPDDPVMNNPVNVQFNGGVAQALWTTEWQDDDFGDPEYSFVASVVGGLDSVQSSNELKVRLPSDPSIVVRTFNTSSVEANGLVEVSLEVEIRNPETYYAIEEYLPPGWVYTFGDGGDTSDLDVLKWENVNTSEDSKRVYTYIARAPSTSNIYNFYGNYSFENLTGPIEVRDVGGVDEIEVIGGVSCTDNDGDHYYLQSSGCDGEPGYLGHNDCNDGDILINPGATEICQDGEDNDCGGDGDASCSACTIDVEISSRCDCGGTAYESGYCCTGGVHQTSSCTPINCDADGDGYDSNNLTCAPDFCECDLNLDGACNAGDLSIFGADMGSTTCGTPPGSGNPPNYCECDLNLDGICNETDSGIFSVDFGRTDCVIYDCNDGNNAINPGATELCNGVNDDCNAGTVDGVDEGWFGDPTTCGVGVCASTGLLICSNGVQNNTCIVGSQSGISEAICNGDDDDCDSSIDENYVPDNSCFLPGVCSSGNSASSCFLGVETDCTSGNPTGADDDCNNIDEDCSGDSDDNYVPSPTVCGTGVCASFGELECQSGGNLFDTCAIGSPTENPESTTCDDTLDNDCDGFTDCSDTIGFDCSIISFCTGCNDEDGDGWNATAVCNTPLIADCNDVFGVGFNIHPGATELCNGVNDDCNAGTVDGVDEGWFGDPTTCGVGVCASSGIMNCSSGGQVNTCSVGSATENPESTCTGGFDEDCDGDIDCDDSSCAGASACLTCRDDDGDGWNTTAECNDGVLVDCNDANDSIHPRATEQCDLVDWDCDGEANSEDETQLFQLCSDVYDYGVCADGYAFCLDGSYQTESCIQPGTISESGNCADEADNDCDGDTDSGDSDCGNPTWINCNECGLSGLLNLVCDEYECNHISEGCYYENLGMFFDGNCYGCSGLSQCSDYPDQGSCVEDNCGKQNCEWNGASCVNSADSDNDGVNDDIDCNDGDDQIGECTGCAVCSDPTGASGSCLAENNLCEEVKCPSVSLCGFGTCGELELAVFTASTVQGQCNLASDVGVCDKSVESRCTYNCGSQLACDVDIPANDLDDDDVPDIHDFCNSTGVAPPVNALGFPIPSSSLFNEFDPNATYADFRNLQNLTLGKTDIARVKFTGSVNLFNNDTGVCEPLDLDRYVNISWSKVEINSSVLKELNKSAVITMYNITLVNPYITQDGVKCPASECPILNYTNKVLTFGVQHFSEYVAPTAETEPVLFSSYEAKEACGNGVCDSDLGETCSNSCGDCGSCETISSGSGGSGGGGGSVPIVPEFSIDQQKSSFLLEQGQSTEAEFVITNDGKNSLSFTLSSDKEMFSLSESSFSIAKGEKKTVKVNILTSEEIVPDLYIGKIIVKSGSVQKEVIISAEVISKDYLFDVIVGMQDKYLKAGEDFEVKVSLTRLVEVSSDEILITYIIKDKDENEILSQSENIIIGEIAEFTKILTLPDDLEEGDYVLYAKVDYQGKVALASVWFNVGGFGLNWIFWGIVTSVLTFIGVVIILIVFIRKRNELDIDIISGGDSNL